MIKPYHDNIIIKQDDPESITKSGIIIPDTAKEPPQQAEVISVGKGKMNDDGSREPMEIQVGDKVLFSKHLGIPFEDNGEVYLRMKASDILGIVDNKED